MEEQPSYAIAAPTIVKLPGEVDTTNCGVLAAELTAVCARGVKAVVVDLTQTTFCDSSAVRMLLQAHKLATSQGVEFEMAVSSPSVLRVLELTGLMSVLHVYPTIEAAVTARQPDPT